MNRIRWITFIVWITKQRFPDPFKKVRKKVRENQEVTDKIYNLIIDRQAKLIPPPMNVEVDSPELKPNKEDN